MIARRTFDAAFVSRGGEELRGGGGGQGQGGEGMRNGGSPFYAMGRCFTKLYGIVWVFGAQTIVLKS